MEKIRTHFIFNNPFFENKAVKQIRNVEKYRTAGQATDDMEQQNRLLDNEGYNIHSKYVYLLIFHCNNGRTNAPQCYVTRTCQFFFLNLFTLS